MGDLSHEQSMEEILSSIKRIIAEDTEAGQGQSRPRRVAMRAPAAAEPARVETDESDVLELTEAAEPEPVAVETPAPPQPQHDARIDAAPVKPAAVPEAAPLVSEQALNASRSSIAALSALIVKPEVAGSDTLEGLVRDMLKPMLATWLEERLPAIVERQVAQEIRRITERG